MPSMSETEPRDALDRIAAANRQMAARAEPPWWYHLTLGLLVGGLVAVQDAPLIWRGVYFIPYGLGLLLLVRAYKRHTGVWISGYRAGRTRWVAVGGAAVAIVLMLVAGWANLEGRLQGAYVAAGLFIVPFITALGHVWQWAYRRDLGDI